MRDAVVAFVHVEVADVEPEREASVFRQDAEAPEVAGQQAPAAHGRPALFHPPRRRERRAAALRTTLLTRLAERLRETGYATHVTPFGWFNEWDLPVHGESGQGVKLEPAPGTGWSAPSSAAGAVPAWSRTAKRSRATSAASTATRSTGAARCRASATA